jgi:hypothetical protein
MKRSYIALSRALAGCASSGAVQTGPVKYTIAKSEWGFTSGAVHTARIDQKAAYFCRNSGKTIKVTGVQKNDVDLGKSPAPEVNFQCIDKQPSIL